MRFIRRIMILATLFGLVACTAKRPEAPTVQLVGLELTRLSLSHANFQARLQLHNPNATDLEIEKMAFALFLNDVEIAEGRTARSFSIPSGEFGDTTLYLASSYFNLLQLSSRLEGASEAHFRLAGEVEVGGPGFLSISVPIDKEGVLPLTGDLQQLTGKPLR